MDQGKTSNAFSLLGPDNQPVAGQSAWSDARTFDFTPTSKLEPASTYLGVFSTSAAALDGTSPKENIQLNFTTVEGLKVGQVFPIADAEDVDADNQHHGDLQSSGCADHDLRRARQLSATD